MRLNRSGIIMASLMVSGNHWSCVHFNIETGDGLYADSIGREVPRYFEETFSNVFQAICKKYKKKWLYQIHPSCSWNSINKKCTQMWTFSCEKFYLSKKQHDCLWGCCNIFCNRDVWFYNSYRNYSKTKNDPVLSLDEWLGII